MKRKKLCCPVPEHVGFQVSGIQGRMCAMTLDQAVDLVRNTLLLALLVAAPMLIVGMLVGIFVSLAQAVTQIQEQTLTFIPKIVAMVASAIVLMPWMSHRLMAYAAAMFTNSPLP
jgi:flagellar biosynthetic protein FliQ